MPSMNFNFQQKSILPDLAKLQALLKLAIIVDKKFNNPYAF